MNCKKVSTSKTMAVSLFLSFCFVLLSSISSTSVAKATKDTLFVGDYLQDGQTLVSSGRRFEFGFFSPGNSSNRYLGIWYKNVPLTVVWIANKDYPITDHSGVLMLTSGDGVSLNNVTHCIWNIRPKRLARSPVLQILDSGNLVLRDGTSGNDPEGYMWQSFDFPCNTLLPGMKLGWNMRTGSGWFMTSWKSADDPSRGDFVFGMENIEMPQLVLRKGWTKESRWGPWDGTRFSGSKELNANPILKSVLTFNAEEVSYTFSVTDNSILVMLVVNQQGLVQYLIWRNHTNEWIPLVNLQTDNCDRYGVCGPYGCCYKDDPECSCLEGFTPSSPQAWSIMDWSDGCTRKWELDCKNGDGFVKYEGLKLPDNSHLWTNKILSHQECEAECLKNCSCMAYTNLDIYGNGSYCVMWSGDLVDMRTSTEDSTEIIYIRMARKELDSIADARRKKLVEKIAIIFLAAVTVILLVGVIGWCTLHIMKKVRQVPGVGILVTDYVEESAVEDLELPYFDMVTISAATNHFASDNKIGQGGFGTVYKGVLPDGQEIAVKRLSKNSGQGLEEFKNEVILIANLQHRNLVKLLGCCIQGEERMLIYEYLPNKSLDNFLFDQTRRKLLPWRKRFSIAIGVARGLLYLHQDSRLRIIHRDLKTSNILLDADMNPKISDFGVARIFGGDQTEEVTKRVIGTYGYMSPEYALSGLFSVKSDVFSFGVVLLEIISGKKNWGFSHPDHDLNLIGHAWKLWNEGNPLEMMDVEMEQSFCIDEVLRCIQVGLLCVQQRAEDRPMVSSVVTMLRNESSELPPPKEPGFCAESSSTGIDALPGELNPHTANEVTITDLAGR